MKTLATKEVTLIQAQAELESIEAQREPLITRQSELGRRLQHVEQEVGRQYLSGDRSGLEEAGKINSELRAINAALAILDDETAESRLELKRAEARDLRLQARAKRAELEELNAKRRSYCMTWAGWSRSNSRTRFFPPSL